MQRKHQPGSDTLRCPDCRRRTRHTVTTGPTQFDPKHPGDSRFACRRVTYRCNACGRTEQREQLPHLLADIFQT